jgi:hypothetical protein
MPLVEGERIKMRDMRPIVIKQLEPPDVAVLYPVTPQRVSIYADSKGSVVKDEFEHLKDKVPIPTQNRRYRRMMRKPFRPNNLRRQTARMKARWANAEQIR